MMMVEKEKNDKKLLSWSNISTTLLLLFALAMVFSPQVKGKVIEGLMKVGLFQPDLPKDKEIKTPLVLENEVVFIDKTGKEVRLSSLRGKVVFINFWATWCPPCIAEMPSIHQMAKQFKENDKLVVLTVDVDQDFPKSLKFMQKRNFDLPVYALASAVPSAYLGNSIPTTIVLSKQGKLVFKHEGGADYTNQEFIGFLNKLIRE
ncbi:TlpA family protein disulfide reductase [Pedobacter aquae]|uniref:TlpA family protein disulfide reductase n=1 Tax=Pedobacter aquae TaxID=2605747 RepID=A0A5C0VF23_9SPHI|nr:TlpA disulfide reductase family protein [Pedobacter aquae]QEK50251.1 TlpA family protein disulfide reductase [Pedobacter aquae]